MLVNKSLSQLSLLPFAQNLLQPHLNHFRLVFGTELLSKVWEAGEEVLVYQGDAKGVKNISRLSHIDFDCDCSATQQKGHTFSSSEKV